MDIPGVSFQSRAEAVGQDEDALALMRCANFSRAEYSPRRLVTEASQVSEDISEPKADVSFDVFEEAESWLAKSNAVCDPWPEMPWVVFAKPLAGSAERLARVAPREDIHTFAKASVWEGLNISPYRGRIKLPAVHTRRQEAAGKLFDLRISDCSHAWQDSSEPQVNAAVSRAKADVSELGRIHVMWVKSGQIKLGQIKSSRVKSKRTDCAGISPATGLSVKWV